MGTKIFEKRGFTLIEIVMVLVIIGLLAGIVVPQFTVQMNEGKITQTRANLENLRSAVAMFYKANGNYPTTLSDMTALGVIKKIPTDAWNQSFLYLSATGEVSCNNALSTSCLSEW